MTLFGLDEAVVTSLTAGVRPATAEPGERRSGDPAATDAHPADPQPADPGEVFARAAWSTIAEPGDGVAGAVVELLGAAAALRSVVEAWPPDRLAGALTDTADASEAGDPAGLRPELEQALARWRPRLSSTEVIRSLQQARRTGTALLLPSDPLWPVGVGDLERHAPLALWWRGRTDALAALRHSIALVGARAATGYGEHVALEAAAGLVDRGLAVVSGAAYGIDGMVHRSALASNGTTVAFLAGGVDRFYPSGHDALLNRIVETGAVASEVPCGVPPTKWRFLQRNRLIAAASQATVVLEAGWRSGSLNTAGHAGTLGRPLGAVPGPVTSAASAGCHRLIREFSAVCVTNADEMAELAPLEPAALRQAQISEHHSDESRLADALSARSPRDATDLARRSGLSVATVQALLGTIELEGRVRENERGWLRVDPKAEKPLA